MSAPRSIMPCLISKRRDAWPGCKLAYDIATSRLAAVDMKALSTPHLKHCSFGCEKVGGRAPITPRCTVVAWVSSDAFMA
eukprot:6176391-Pleurochrysis_carterae.AAC.4